jgi:hypothetical protein
MLPKWTAPIALALLMAGCSNDGERVEGAEEASTVDATTTVPVATSTSVVVEPSTTIEDQAWTRLEGIEAPPIFPDRVPYQLANGRVLWVDERSGVGDVIGDPGMTADEWKCDNLTGPAGPFYEATDDIPNFDGLVCRSWESAWE